MFSKLAYHLVLSCV